MINLFIDLDQKWKGKCAYKCSLFVLALTFIRFGVFIGVVPPIGLIINEEY